MSLFTRISNLFRGFLSLFVSGLEKQNPEALLELEKQNLRKLISQYNEGLASHAGLSERLMTQVKKLENDEQELTIKAGAHLRAGNRDNAAQYALRLQTVQRELAENYQQLEQEEKTYENLIRTRDLAISEAKAKIESISRALGDLKVKRATAELTEMAAGMISEIGGAGDTLNRLQEMVEGEREQAAGRARVARDSLDVPDLDVQELEQKAMADQALASFEAQAGFVLEAEPIALADDGASGTGNPAQGAKTIDPASR